MHGVLAASQAADAGSSGVGGGVVTKNDVLDEAKQALREWLHAEHPPDECDGDCVTTRRIFLDQAEKVLDSIREAE